MSTKFQKPVFLFWKFYIKIYRKQTNRQSFLHINLEHPNTLRDNIPNIQALRIKQICTLSKGFEHHCKELKKRFLEQGYNSELSAKLIKIEKADRENLIKCNKKDTSITTNIPLIAITHNRSHQTLVKLFEKIWTYYQWTNAWKKDFQTTQLHVSSATKISRNSLLVTKSKTHKQKCNKNINRNKQKHSEPGKCSNVLEIAQLCAVSKPQQH